MTRIIPFQYQSGFTIFELVISIATFTILSTGIIVLVLNIFQGSDQQQGLLYENDQARRISFQFVNDVRDASYSNTGAFPITAAGDQSLTLYSNIDSDSLVERVRYYISNGILYRATLKPSGTPLTYQGTESIAAVQRNVANGVTPLFYYYGADYIGATDPLSAPISPADISLVEMNLMIYNDAGKVQHSYTVSSSATIRNLKTNLAD